CVCVTALVWRSRGAGPVCCRRTVPASPWAPASRRSPPPSSPAERAELCLGQLRSWGRAASAVAALCADGVQLGVEPLQKLLLFAVAQRLVLGLQEHV